MSEIVEYIILAVAVSGSFLAIRLLTTPKKKHQWYEVNSSDIANAERKKKRGK